jgi:hypothetical protein
LLNLYQSQSEGSAQRASMLKIAEVALGTSAVLAGFMLLFRLLSA